MTETSVISVFGESVDKLVAGNEVRFSATAEVDEFGVPFSVEIMPFIYRNGEGNANLLVKALSCHGLEFSFSEEVDSLVFAFRDAWKSFGQRGVVLVGRREKSEIICLNIEF